MDLSITTTAAKQIRRVIDEQGHGQGLRVSVKPSGCSGYSYVLGIADWIDLDDVVIEDQGVAVIVAPEAVSMVDGSEIDYVTEGLNRFFRFNNPNVQDECGCGESFSIN